MAQCPEPTSRLRFATWSTADWEAFHPIATDPRVMRYLNEGNPWSDERIELFVKRQVGFQQEHGFSLWRLLSVADGRLVGICGLQPWRNSPSGEIEIGWWLAPDCWGRGLATEAGRAALAHGFEAGLRRIVAIIHPDNLPSQNVAKRLGLTFDRRADHDGREVLVYEIEKPQD